MTDKPTIQQGVQVQEKNIHAIVCDLEQYLKNEKEFFDKNPEIIVIDRIKSCSYAVVPSKDFDINSGKLVSNARQTVIMVDVIIFYKKVTA